MRSIRARAFTLIELLTVMAISAILLGIIVLPVMQSFNLTRAAQAFSDAQDKARLISERIAREIGNASSVRDTSYTVTVKLPGGGTTTMPASSMVFPLPGPDAKTNSNWTPVEVAIPYTKIDLIKPAEGDPLDQNGGAYRNPVTGKYDPTMGAPKGQVNLPLVPSSVLVRYFVALRDPNSKYNAPYDGLMMAANGSRDNLFVLYRAEIPMRKGGLANTDFFEANPDGSPKIDDPRFMIPDGTQAKAQRIQNWLSHSVVQTEVSRYDMIQPVYNKATRQVTYDGSAARVVPLIQFRPTLVSNDPASGETTSRAGEETFNAKSIAPDVFETRYGLWSNFIIRDYAPTYHVGDDYQVGSISDESAGFQIWDVVPPVGKPRMLFHVSVYENGVANSLSTPNYPFTAAALYANQYDIDASLGAWLEVPELRAMFAPYDFNARQGRITTSFPIDQVGDPTKPALDHPNLPVVATGAALGAAQDDGAGAVWGGPGYQINRAFNRAWKEFPDAQNNLFRFIDLRTTPNEDKTLPPLYPNHILGTVTGFPRARIVPGSEVVYGPDQIAGPNYGQLIRYTRVPANPGPNQYTINYVDKGDPADYTALGIPSTALSGFDPNTYDSTNFVSAFIQPQFRAGFIKLNSDPNVPLPESATAPFRVSYRFQFNGSVAQPAAGTSGTDMFTVDYDSRQLMAVLVTIRNYAQSNLPNAQTVTLKATATVRNLIR